MLNTVLHVMKIVRLIVHNTKLSEQQIWDAMWQMHHVAMHQIHQNCLKYNRPSRPSQVNVPRSNIGELGEAFYFKTATFGSKDTSTHTGLHAACDRRDRYVTLS